MHLDTQSKGIIKGQMLALHTQIWLLIVCFTDADVDPYSTDALLCIGCTAYAHVNASSHICNVLLTVCAQPIEPPNSNRGMYCFFHLCPFLLMNIQ